MMNKKGSLIKTFAILLTMIGFLNIYHAEEPISKEITFAIDKSYEACAFTITTEQTGNFAVSLKSEKSMNIYNAVIEDSNTCQINVKDVSSGNWKVIIKETVKEESSNETEEVSVEERTADSVIGKIKVSAKAIDETAFSIGNVQIARDIVGLKYYFKDESIVVEWTDTSCGNVNIVVIDANNSQILNKETVEDNYYEFEIPKLTNEITLNIVPSTSASITGANTQITIPVVNKPNATVTYEDKEYTNREVVDVTVQLNDTYSLLFMCNGIEVKNTGVLAAGTYEYEIPISEGVNSLLTYVIDTNHNMRSTPHTITRDSVKPALTLDMEYDGAATYDDVAYITGTIKDYDTFKINEVEPVVTGDGSFKAEYLLNDGINHLQIIATDIAGNETVYNAEITKLVKTTPKWFYYIPPFSLIVIIAVVIFIRKKKTISEPDMKIEKKTKIKTAKEQTSKEHKGLKEWQKSALEYVVLFAIAGYFFTHIILWGVVPTESMEPTLKVGDIAIVNGLAYVKNEPQRGDIVIFKDIESNSGNTLVKRIIGLPGDSLMFIDGYIYINGELCYEEYLNEDIETNSFKDFEVPEGCYFVLGDNREESYDSRYWSNPYITLKDIKGKVITILPTSEIIR